MRGKEGNLIRLELDDVNRGLGDEVTRLINAELLIFNAIAVGLFL